MKFHGESGERRKIVATEGLGVAAIVPPSPPSQIVICSAPRRPSGRRARGRGLAMITMIMTMTRRARMTELRRRGCYASGNNAR